uniref:Olfactory receptor family 5 subfamily B member 12 n=1 Tax=Saimiri boliviensis boliviensis TaxID=39432 RepID=A0A2K6UQI3_SAIBB
VENNTEVTEFILVGLTDDPELQIPLFIIFLFIYLITLVGNLGMTELILLDSRLHIPMYFFLSNLSLVDFGYSSAVTPKLMVGCLTGDKYIYTMLVSKFLLASMAYDHYAAVCKPLHYTTTMTTNVCACLTIGSYICGFLNASIHTGNTFRLSFCRSNVVEHFLCDAPPLLALSCSGNYISEMVIFLCGRKKAFSTCASHLTAVSIFYGKGIFISSHSMGTDKMASVFYAIVVPMLNPLVYSLRNKDVKSAFKKTVGKAKASIGFIF